MTDEQIDNKRRNVERIFVFTSAILMFIVSYLYLITDFVIGGIIIGIIAIVEIFIGIFGFRKETFVPSKALIRVNPFLILFLIFNIFFILRYM